MLISRITLGRVLYRTKRAPEAEPLLANVVEKLRTAYPGDKAGLSSALNALALSIRHQGRTPVEQLREAHELDVELWGEDRALASRFNYGTALVVTGKLAEAEPVLRGAYDGYKRVHGSAHGRTLRALKSLANCLDRLKRHTEAEPLWVELVGRRREAGNPFELGNTLLLYGVCMTSQKRHAEAEPLFAECLKVREKILPDGHWLRYDTMSLLGGCLTELKEFERAEPLLLEAYKMKPPPHAAQFKAQATARIVRLYEAWGKPDKAEEWRVLRTRHEAR